MIVDHFFTIGAPHISQGRPCEDYARSGLLAPELAIGAVADGCSGAFANTEVGAQAIVFAFERAIGRRRDLTADWFGNGFSDVLVEQFAGQRISEADDDYLATLVGFAANRNNAAVYVVGDGAVALRFSDGRLKLVEVEWANNAPYYLNYRLRPGATERFLDQFGGQSSAPVTLSTTVFRSGPDGPEILDVTAETVELEAMACGYVLTFLPETEGIDALAVVTDGVSRVGGLSPLAVTAELLAFKNFRGDFVKRRCLRALEGFKRRGQLLGDDLGMACVTFGSG